MKIIAKIRKIIPIYLAGLENNANNRTPITTRTIPDISR